MSDYRKLLERVGDRVPMPEPAFERITRRRHRKQQTRRITAGVLGVSIAIALVFALSNAGSSPGPEPATSPTVSPSNGWIAYTAPDHVEGGGGIFLAREGSTPVRIVGSSGDGVDELCPAFSPDGTRLAYTEVRWPHTATLVVMDVDEGGIAQGTGRELATPRTLEPNLHCATWAPDSRRLLYADDVGLWIVSANDDQPPTYLRALSGSELPNNFEWSPDGTRIALATGEGGMWIVSADDGELLAFSGDARGRLEWRLDGTQVAAGTALIDADDGALHELATDAPLEGTARWSPDGSLVALFHDRRIVIVRASDGTWSELPKVDLPGISDQTFGMWSLEWSPDGTRLLTAQGCFVVSVSADGTSPPLLVSSAGAEPWACTRPPEMDWQTVFR